MDKYQPIYVNENNEAFVRADLVFPNKYTSDTGEYISADAAAGALYVDAKLGSEPALNLLYELCGNYMNKYAFNALNELGKMSDITDENTRTGFAQFLFDAYKFTDREKLEMIAFWSYPSFSYTEVDSTNTILYKTNSEADFVDRLIDEMVYAHSKKISIKMRMNENNGDYYVDVMIGNLISSFYFIFGDKTFLGIRREYDI